MIIPTGKLSHEISAGSRGAAAAFDREGYGIGRGVLPADMLRAVRAPLIEALVADGHVEPVEDDEDRFRWVGDEASFEKNRYREALQADVEELLVRSGLAARAIETIWGRRPALWERVSLFVSIPGAATDGHRDGWMMTGVGGPDQHSNFWCPLTRLDQGDGQLAVAAGSHRIADQPAPVPVAHPMHRDVLENTGNRPADDVLAPLWRTASFEVGDAILFRPDIVHGAIRNDGPHVRIAFVLLSQDEGEPLAVAAGLSVDSTRALVDVEWLTLAILAVQPSSSWLARQAFCPRGIVARMLGQQRDELATRAFTTLQARGLIEPYQPHDPAVATWHQYFDATAQGRSEVAAWLTTPSPDDAQLLSAKLLFCDWLELDATELLADRRGLGEQQS